MASTRSRNLLAHRPRPALARGGAVTRREALWQLRGLGAAGLLCGLGLAPSARAHTSSSGAAALAPQAGPPDACADPLAPFVEEMLQHCRGFSPLHCAALSDQALRAHLRATLARAEGWGFTWRGPTRTVIEMTFLFGSSFDSDPQYPWAGAALRAEGPQMERATQLYHRILRYQDEVSGAAERRALLSWWRNAEQLALSTRDLERDLVVTVRRIFPEKAAVVGREGLDALIAEGLAQARELGMHDPGRQGFVVGLMLALGHGCVQDPLLPMVRPSLLQAAALEPEPGLSFLRAALLRHVAHAAAGAIWSQG